MSEPATLVWMALLLAVGGWGGLGLSSWLSARRFSLSEVVGLLVVWGILFCACSTLALAHIGLFSWQRLAVLSAAWGLAGAVLFRISARRRPAAAGARAGKGAWLFMGAVTVLLAAVAGFIAPANKYLGGWDTGAYVNIASEIARSGKISVTDPFLAELPPRERAAYMHKSEPPRLGWHVGYQIVDADTGLLSPDFYHLYPAWLALWSALGGLNSLWTGHGILALCALLMIALTGESSFGGKAAFLAVFLFSFCPIQAYAMKTTLAEPFTQFALFAGLWALSRMFRNEHHSRGFALTAGLAWMAALMSHATALLPVGVGLVYLCAYAARDWKSGRWKQVLPIAAGAGLGMAGNWMRSGELTAFVLKLVGASPVWWAGGLVLLVAALTILLRVRSFPFGLVCLGLIVGFGIRPLWFPGPEARNLPVFIDLLGWMGLAGVLAFFWRWRGRDWPEDVRMLVFMGIVVTGVLLINKRASPFYLWASRRWVEFALPCMFLLAAAGIVRFAAKWNPRFKVFSLLTAGSLIVCWGYELWPTAHLAYKTREYENMPEAMGNLARELKNADYILSERWDVPAVLRYTYGLPAWGLSRTESSQAARDGRLAAEQMRRWVSQGSRVYWIGSWFADPVLRLTEVAQLVADGRIMELSPDRLPSTVVTDPLRAMIYHVSSSGGDVPGVVDIGESPMGIISGFGKVLHAQNRTREKFDYRLIKRSKASFFVPGLPGKWRIRMANIGRAEELADVIIRVNGRIVEQFQVDGEWSDYVFVMPECPTSIVPCELEVKSDGELQLHNAVGVDFIMETDSGIWLKNL